MDLSSIHLPAPLALALVALLGYLFGRRGNQADANTLIQQSRRELRRAQMVAAELEKIAKSVRRGLARHHASLNRFRERVQRLSGEQEKAAWQDLCREAEGMLKPTLHLATQMADAYDQLRQQSAHLMTFTELRTDPLTGVSNRRAFDDSLNTQFAMMSRYDSQFSLAMFDIDHFKQVNDAHGHLQGDRILQDVAKLLDDAVRETDIVARYGGEEFVVIMPQTNLAGASVFAQRLRYKVAQELSVTVSGGLAAAAEGDTPDSLVARADAALYSAKAAGRNNVFRHTGEILEAVEEAPEPTLA